MEQHSNAGFRRTLRFTRDKTQGGLFAWPVITFTLKREDGTELGQLTMKAQRATYTSPIAPQDEFRLKKNFWGTRWFYENDDQPEFGRFSFGWSFKPSFLLRSGERYYLRAKRRWPFGRKADDPTQAATFTRDHVPVMLLQSFSPSSFFYNEVTAPMEGTISTDIDNDRTIVALLLFYQTFIEARNKSAH